jgi:hypothetical protein
MTVERLISELQKFESEETVWLDTEFAGHNEVSSVVDDNENGWGITIKGRM